MTENRCCRPPSERRNRRPADRNLAFGRETADRAGGGGGIRGISVAACWISILPDGRQRVVRHGHDPVRPIQTGIGPVEVEKPKARDRGATATRSASAMPRRSCRNGRGARRASTSAAGALSARRFDGRFPGVLTALLGKDAPNLSPAVIARLKGEWEDEYQRWQKRDLSARRYVYVWADGVYLQARMEPQAECMLVLIGATPEGKKELLGFQAACARARRAGRNCSSI